MRLVSTKIIVIGFFSFLTLQGLISIGSLNAWGDAQRARPRRPRVARPAQPRAEEPPAQGSCPAGFSPVASNPCCCRQEVADAGVGAGKPRSEEGVRDEEAPRLRMFRYALNLGSPGCTGDKRATAEGIFQLSSAEEGSKDHTRFVGRLEGFCAQLGERLAEHLLYIQQPPSADQPHGAEHDAEVIEHRFEPAQKQAPPAEAR